MKKQKEIRIAYNSMWIIFRFELSVSVGPVTCFFLTDKNSSPITLYRIEQNLLYFVLLFIENLYVNFGRIEISPLNIECYNSLSEINFYYMCVRQGDTISPKLFTSILKRVF